MKFKYIGNEKSILLRDVKFMKGKPVDLSKNRGLAAKVSRLPYFENVTEEAETNDDPK